MKPNAATRRPSLEILGRPEGGLGETGPTVVSPSRADAAQRDVLATLHRLIDTLTELANERPREESVAEGCHLPLLLNAVEAGQLLSISRAKVLDLAARGEIPSVRIGGSVRIPRDSLQTWIADRANSTSTTSIPLAAWAHRWSNES